ncbi:SusC/RagA family TonB-linked outer membrane protein [Cyclobacterium marinum]|uniref:TonB-dependent receptor plug n=1 Tax=Cyclobacterium marinum (strain ATCC 25205 / DSM 745 / LMG 13164 / NCIMB 1802) TaxID=880070 RepID=G0J8C7_CYCMS|nr:TonB-dependent receptor [Cyclobacterium marinum]AEL28727.1 TonB-dependent receptor plug [Cyclobacterium marinum DSM 745]
MKRKLLYLIKMVSKNLLYGLLLQCLFMTTLAAHEISAQIRPIDKSYIKLKKVQWELGEIFQKVENSTDYQFVLPEEILDNNPNLNLKNKRQSINDLLVDIALAADLRFKQVDNSIYVAKGNYKDDRGNIEILIEERPIKGRVVDSNGQGIPGATVLVQGTNIGTATDIDGNFSFEVPENAVLIFSFIGYQQQVVSVGNRSEIEVTMTEDLSSLDEVVVVGYGTQKKVNLTGAVSSITSKEIVNQPVGQTSMALQGIAPGVTVTQRSGQPGSDGGSIRIRGVGTLGDSNPLVMVDGIETNLNNVDPNEIESISILKDASSAAIYGARAANGVVLITTKRGIEGVRVNYNMYAGFQVPTQLPEIVGAIDHMEMANEAFTNVGNDPQYTDEFIEAYKAGMPSDQYPDTDWQEITMSNVAFMQNHNLSINAGSEKSKLFASVSYLDQEGIIPNTSFNRFNLRLNSDINVSERLTLSTDIFLRRAFQKQPSSGTSYVFHWMRRIPSNEVGILSNGRYGEGWNGDHPLARAKDGGLNTNESLDAILNFRLNYKISEGLNAEVMYAPKFWNPHSKVFSNITQTYARDGVTPTHFVPQRNSLSESYTREWYNNLRAIVTYDKTFNQVHTIGVTAGYQQEDQTNAWISAYREVFPLPQYEQINAGNRANERTGGAASHWALQSVFGRVTYNFDERYLLEGNVRRDASSRFAEGNRSGVFPSFSAGWRVSEESFMEPYSGIIDQLKLRASWGQLGNQNIGLYPFAAFMSLGGGSQDYTFNGENSPGAALNSMANSSIKWETTETTDIGLDFNLWGKLDVSADYYIRRTKDILLALNIPQTLGLSAPFQNAGEVLNKGYDLMVNYRNKVGELNYSIMVNYSDVRNEIIDMRGIENTGLTVNREGYSIGSFFGYVDQGLFQTQEEVDNHADQFGNIAPGDIKYKDIDEDGMINDRDLAVIGSPIPRHTFGLRVSADYKGFDLSVFLQGVGKADGYMYGQGIMPFYLGGTVQEQHKDRWTPANTDAAYPRLAWNQTNNEQNSSFWMRNAAYLRGQNIQVGYTFSETVLSKLNIRGLRMYLSGRNVFTVHDFYEGYDPEAPVSNGGWYPQMATYTMGLNVNF